MKTRFDVHQEITNRIVAAIEAGAGEFKLPWHRAASTRSPINATTGREYRGVNILSLWITTQALGYESHEWATFKQWQERGVNVRRGEKGTPIVFYKNLHVESSDVDSGEDAEGGRTIPFARARPIPITPRMPGVSNVFVAVRVSERLKIWSACWRATAAS